GKITQQKNWVSGEEVTYLYDELERLSSAATTSTAWGLAWSYDGFGNRLSQNLTKGTGPTNSTLVDANTNRLSSFGYAYNANGNMTNMPQQNAQLSYDSSNRMTRFSDLNDAESYQYAPDNKRIWRSKGCSYYNQATGNNEPRPQVIFYSVFGQKLGDYCLTDNVSVIQEYLYFGGRMVAKTNIGGGPTLQSFKTDRLHSNQDAPGGGFFPYGETKSGAATTGESFATYSRDWHGLDYADQRWYAGMTARFATPDDSNKNEMASSPSSWNRFSYSSMDPINATDANGQATCWIDRGTNAYNQVVATTICRIGIFEWHSTQIFDPRISGSEFERVYQTATQALQIALASAVDRKQDRFDSLWNDEMKVVGRTLNRAAQRLRSRRDCAELFGGLASHGIYDSRHPSTQMMSDLMKLDVTGATRIHIWPQRLWPSPSIPAYHYDGSIFILSGGTFFTGTDREGNPISSSWASGLSRDEFQDVILIHEYLHMLGIAGADDKGQTIKFPDGTSVIGTDGISQLVRNRCI
ncbi:RHS repeat-associated core domain-containing protein, partial [Nostoc sp. NIES-2111]